MSMKPLVWRGLLAALLLLPLLSLAQERQNIDRIVALVEEDVILQSELDQAIGTITRQMGERGANLPPRNVMEEQVLERLILTRLEILRAEGSGIRASDSDVDQSLEQVAQQNGMTMSQLRAAIEADGLDFREFRREVRNEMLSNQLRQRVAQSMDEITETEVDILLASERFGGAEYLLSQLVIIVPESASPDEVQQARERAENARRQLDDGLDFPTAALTFSQSPDALEGGDVGWRNINAMPPMFADAIRAVEPGQVTDLIRTPAGFVILHIRDRRDQSQIIVREFKARHLMIEATELVTPEQARRQIYQLHERLEAGEDFATLARRHSTDESSANIGGLFNWFPKDQYGPAFQAQLDQLEPGDLSQPFQSPGAWHVLLLEDVREADRTVDTLRAEARDLLYRQKAEEEVERFLRQLRGESYVEIRL
jgi:peptidyl-prolyl cis-trans isomerase SurA